jgi:hypothetical protein
MNMRQLRRFLCVEREAKALLRKSVQSIMPISSARSYAQSGKYDPPPHTRTMFWFYSS